MSTGQFIKAIRKEKGLTQKELASKLGIAYQTLAQWENGFRNPKYETLVRIADALGVSVSSLSTGYPSKTNLVEPSLSSEVSQIVHDHALSPSLKILGMLPYLNAKGQLVAVERVEELTKIPDYQKAENPADDT